MSHTENCTYVFLQVHTCEKVELLLQNSICDMTFNKVSRNTEKSLLEAITSQFSRTDGYVRFSVLMICGIAGTGKTTLAKAIIREHPRLIRLSIDEIIFERYGLFGIDYAADTQLYAKYQEEAYVEFLQRFHTLLKDKKDMILDLSFYSKSDRGKIKSMIEAAGGVSVLVYLKPSNREALWLRICERSAKPKDANSTFAISREIFDSYWEGFEVPIDEEEVVLDVM